VEERGSAVEAVELSPAFWRGRRVLVTGHTGFKGAWLSLWLQELGADLFGFAKERPSEPGLFELAGVAKGMRERSGDLRDPEALRRAFAEHSPEVVLHLGAQAIVSRALADPGGTFETNLTGTLNLLEAARATESARAVVVVTSDKVYAGTPGGEGYTEDDRLGGDEPYAASKAAADLLAGAYRKSYFEPESRGLATARAGNVIGGGDWAEDRLVPDLMRAALGGPPAAIRRPGAVRPWQHVLDPLSGYLVLAQRLWDEPRELGAPWNFAPAPEDAWPVERMVERLGQLWGSPIPVERAADPFPETDYLRLDASRARERLGWSPGLDVERALAAVVDWYRGYAGEADVRELTLAQIRSHPLAPPAAGAEAGTRAART
jgi:CDP-glucose 4,6-dehydratase